MRYVLDAKNIQPTQTIGLKNRPNYSFYLLLVIIPVVFGACTQTKIKAEEDLAISHLQASLFFNQQQDDEARNKAFIITHSTDKTNYTTLSSLYSIIGSSYKNSFHFDSSIYYMQIAYALAFKTDNTPLKVVRSIELLRLYTRSVTYNKEMDSLFKSIDNFDRTKLPLKIQAMLSSAVAEYYYKTDRAEFSLYAARLALSTYNQYLITAIPNKEDSTNIGLCYLQISNAYAYINYISGLKQIIKNSEVLEGLHCMQNARKWTGINNDQLPMIYTSMIGYKYLLPVGEKIQIELLYRDSLMYLATTTGYNLNDRILLANLSLCNLIYQASLQGSSYKRSDYWQYYNEALKYKDHLIDPTQIYKLQWLEGTLYLREAKHRQSLHILLPLQPHSRLFTLRQQQLYLNSIILNYRELKKIDSVMFYYKLYYSTTDSLAGINSRKAMLDAENKYQNQEKQKKIERQNIIIEYSSWQRLWLSIGILSLSGAVILLIFIYRNKRFLARNLNNQNTALTILNQQLDEADQTKSKLFAIISHDLRGPILQLHYLLRLKGAKTMRLTPEETLEHEQEIQFATANLLENVDGLLTWSKTQLQSFAVTKSFVDVNKLVEQCVNLMNPIIDSKHLQIDNRIAALPESVMIETDANFLLAILRNILGNAIKASPIEGILIIEYILSETSITRSIKITNQGTSFTQEEYQKILKEPKTSDQLWNGLGLQMVDELSRKIDVVVFFETTPNQSISCTISFTK